MTALYEDTRYKRHDIEMLAIAEACCTPEEVEAVLRPIMARAYRRSMKTHATVREARSAVLDACEKFLGQHYYVLPRQRITLASWSKVYLKGYQKWWRRVKIEEGRIAAKNLKNGKSGNSLADALRLISPELFVMEESCA